MRQAFTKWLAISLVSGFIMVVNRAYAAEMPVISATKLRCEDLDTPRAVERTDPRLGWICESADPVVRAQMQTAYQVLVADSPAALENDQGNLWDSGKVKSGVSTFIAYAGKPLKAHQEVYWKARLWNRDDAVSSWSQPAFWSMGFLPSAPWEPTWIGSEGRTDLFRKEFSVKKTVKRAWVYGSALGLYVLHLNGSKVGSDLFAPGWTDYRQRVQYPRYDVTDLVRVGDNAVGAETAPGWFAGKMAWFGPNKYGKQVAFAAELHVEFADGTTQIVATDGTWKTSPGPLTASDIQDGDQVDARLEKDGWNTPGYIDSV